MQSQPAPPLPMPAPEPGDITTWLRRLNAGPGAAEPQAGEQVYTLLYNELRRIARAHMRREADGHTLGTTGLLHEAWFRMAGQNRTEWRNRTHFLAVASTMMRRILVDHAAAARAAKSDADCVPLDTAVLDQVGAVHDRDTQAVHEALLAFEQVDARAAKVVELRFFGGLEVEEVAEVLGISAATVKRDWLLARAWLRRALGAPA
jgi:RNA polymerase sigma factor (TIGR02999 family)